MLSVFFVGVICVFLNTPLAVFCVMPCIPQTACVLPQLYVLPRHVTAAPAWFMSLLWTVSFVIPANRIVLHRIRLSHNYKRKPQNCHTRVGY